MENDKVTPQVDITLKIMEFQKAFNKIVGLADLATSNVPVYGEDLLATYKAHSDLNFIASNLVAAIGDAMVAKGLRVSK